MSIVPRLRILGLQVFSISVILLHRASKCFTRNLACHESKVIFHCFYLPRAELAWYQKPKFPDGCSLGCWFPPWAILLHFLQLCVVLEFCYLITATNNGTCTYSGCLGSKDTHYCLNLSFSRLQAHKT